MLRRVALLAVCATFLGPQAAHAAIPPCPAAPLEILAPALTDTDRLVVELRNLRRESALSCDAIRQAGVETRDAADAHRASATAQAADARTDATAIRSAIEALPVPAGSGTETAPAVVKLATTGPLPDELVDAYEGTTELLWWIGGLLVVALAAPFVRDMVKP